MGQMAQSFCLMVAWLAPKFWEQFFILFLCSAYLASRCHRIHIPITHYSSSFKALGTFPLDISQLLLDVSLSVDNLNPIHSNVMRTQTAPLTKSIQERCGINTTFPGITEYMKRYNQKRLPEKVTDYRINPTPDFSIYGRPTAKVCFYG